MLPERAEPVVPRLAVPAEPGRVGPLTDPLPGPVEGLKRCQPSFAGRAVSPGFPTDDFTPFEESV